MKYALLIVILIPFLNISYATPTNETVLPDQSQTEEYVKNLIKSYNSMVKFYEANKPEFENNKNYFLLYRDEGHSFKVFVVDSEPANDYLYLIFVPILSDNPIIVSDSENKLNDFLPGIKFRGEKVITNNNLIAHPDTILRSDFITCAKKEKIISNGLKNSKELAEYFYKENKNTIRINKIENIWKPFKEENKDVIYNNYFIRKKTAEIDKQIDYNWSYTYEFFSNDFDEISIIMTHYRHIPSMIKRWREFINSFADIELSESTNIRVIEIENNLTPNVYYLPENLEYDIIELNQTINQEIEEKQFWNWSFVRISLNHIRNIYSVCVYIIAIFALLMAYIFLKDEKEKKKLIKYIRNDFKKMKNYLLKRDNEKPTEADIKDINLRKLLSMSFSEKVLELTKKIPEGKVATYGDVARALGNPKASRAAGSALNRNKHPIITPCHRVIKSTGKVGGYSGGKEKKAALLKKEGIPIKEGKIINLKHHLHKFKKSDV